MGLNNSTTRFGAITMVLHWSVFLLFLSQYVSGSVMMRIERGHKVFGYGQGDWYTWHKSVGLVVIALVLLRIVWRKSTRLPDWPDTLASWEAACMKWTERTLYLCMVVMPVSGYVFTLAGGYNFKLFGAVPLPQLIPKNAAVADVAQVLHITFAFVIVGAVALHVALALKRHLVDRDRFLKRMVP